MAQEDTTRSMKIQDLTILLVLLDGQLSEILKQCYFYYPKNFYMLNNSYHILTTLKMLN